MPSGALLSGLQPQGQAVFWREAHDHPSLPSPLSRWGLFSNCDFISNYCLHTDAASHRKGKYTMSHIITRGPCQGGAELEARGATSSNCALLLQGQQQVQRDWGFQASKQDPQTSSDDSDMSVKGPGPSRATPTHRHLRLLSLTREWGQQADIQL